MLSNPSCNHVLCDLDINTDPNYNYEIFSKHLQAAKSKHIPKKIKKFNKRKHKKEKWMTNELLIKIVGKNILYVKWKTTPINLEKYEEIKKQFKECEKNVIKLMKEAKQQYFDRIFTAYRTDLKKTWRTISETLCRNKKHSDVPSRFFFMMEKNYLSRKQLQMPLMYILPILAKI